MSEAVPSEQRVEILKFISETHRNQFNLRREVEWKVLLSTLGVFALSAAGKLAGQVTLPATGLLRPAVWIGFLALAAITGIYLRNMHAANGTNKDFAETAERTLIEIAAVPALLGAQTRAIPTRLRANWSYRWQLLTLVAFSITTAFLITFDLPSP